MASVLYSFTKTAPGRFTAVDPATGKTVGTVFGSSNNWRAEQLDGRVINNCYARRQHAAEACRDALSHVRNAGQL